MMETELMTAQELAKALKVTVDTIWRYTRMGRIPCVRLGPRDYRYDLRAVLSALDAMTASPPVDAGGGVHLKPANPDHLRAFAGKRPVAENHDQ